MTLVETLVALALLGLGILMAGSVVVWADRMEERAEGRASALELAAGVAERVRSVAYGRVRTGELDLSGELPPAGLEEPVVELHVEEDEDLGVKDVRIVVRWQGEHPGRFVLQTAVGRQELYR